MNGIKMSDCKFYVNKEKRTVICVIDHTASLVIDFIHDHFMFHDIDIYASLNFTLYKELRMPHSFMGKATCAEGDEWNEETGRLIAFSRAKDKCYKSFFRRASKLVQILDGRLGEMIELFNNFGLKLEAKREALENKIDELVEKK